MVYIYCCILFVVRYILWDIMDKICCGKYCGLYIVVCFLVLSVMCSTYFITAQLKSCRTKLL